MCLADLTPETTKLALELYGELLRQGGIVLHEDTLSRALGYKSVGALNKAIAREQLALPFFRMPNRRGRFCLAAEVAEFVARQRLADGNL
jgi:hypothetical protein